MVATADSHLIYSISLHAQAKANFQKDQQSMLCRYIYADEVPPTSYPLRVKLTIYGESQRWVNHVEAAPEPVWKGSTVWNASNNAG
jgi:hypothetical protein